MCYVSICKAASDQFVLHMSLLDRPSHSPMKYNNLYPIWEDPGVLVIEDPNALRREWFKEGLQGRMFVEDKKLNDQSICYVLDLRIHL